MKTKICPCCDQPITGIYCKGCRKIVLNPVEQDIKYFLNRRHPEFETDCSFHGNTATDVRTADHVMTPYESEAKKAEIKARMQARKQEQKPRASTARKPGAASVKPIQTVLNGDVIRTKKNGTVVNVEKRRRSGLIAMITAFLVVFVLIFTFVMISVVNSMNHLTYDFAVETVAPEPDYAIDWAVPETFEVSTPEELEDWERTDEEVKAAGEACTGYGHFDVTFYEIRDVFANFIDDAGFRIFEESSYSYNSQMDYASWYQTVYDFTIDTKEDYIGTIEIEVDTATNQIHGISIYNSEMGHFYELLDTMTKFMYEAGLVSEELPDGKAFYQAAMVDEGRVQMEDGFVMINGLEVTCYVPEDLNDPDFFSMTIYAPGYYTEVEE
ncbi:MAG: hypothetical protein IJ374_03850 [Lachnospiraceae bacterium]|nr:hypothetical protein [Lachnospiraceae bacterium]